MNSDVKRISAEESAYLERPITAHLVGCQSRRPVTFVNHYLSGVSSIYRQDEFYWYSGAQQQVRMVVRLLDREPDIVFVHRLEGMIPVLRSGRRPAHMFFDLDDIVHRVRLQRALQPPMRPGKLGHLCQIPAIAVAERRAAGASLLTFVCSEVDRARLRRLGFPRVAVVPNALPLPPGPPALPTEPTILFLGACHYPPNRRAAERLIRQVFPRVRAVVPEARLLIGGQGSLDLASGCGSPAGVHYLGYVEDLAALYGSTRMVCCPITSGSGTRLKLIEAAGYARAMIATRFAAEGLDFRRGSRDLVREKRSGDCHRLRTAIARRRAVPLAGRGSTRAYAREIRSNGCAA